MSPRSVSAREIIGRRIVGFVNPTEFARDGRVDRTAYHPDPRILLDDGSYLFFITEETDHDQYGIFVGRSPKPKGRKP